MRLMFWIWFIISFVFLIYSFFQKITVSNILTGMLLVGMGILGLELERISRVKKSLIKRIEK